MEIRKAKKGDEKEIANILMVESAKAPYNEKYTAETAREEVTNLYKGEVYVAASKTEVIGFIAGEVTPDNKEKAYIKELWLKEESQKKGVGKELVETIESIYKKKGVKTIRLVAKRQAGAFIFYKKQNYSEYKDLVFMEKKI